MILIEHAEGGLRLARWSGEDGRPLETFFVAEDELAALLAKLREMGDGRWEIGVSALGPQLPTPNSQLLGMP